jgi:hypothetical protein
MSGHSSDPSQQERRAFPRHHNPRPQAVPWLALVGPNPWTATILNISASGLAVVSAHTYPVGFETKIEFCDGVNHVWHSKRVRAAHCTPQRKNVWLVGAGFEEPFTAREFQDLVPEGQR